MDILLTLLGFAMFYFWIHAVVIVIKKTEAKGYEKIVLIVALVFALLYLLGTINE
jgi:uncharacterized membrane protein YqaE (UPF0057 family)